MIALRIRIFTRSRSSGHANPYSVGRLDLLLGSIFCEALLAGSGFCLLDQLLLLRSGNEWAGQSQVVLCD